MEAFFVSFWSGVEKEPQEFVLLQGKNSNNNKENKGKVNKNKENNVHCPFFVSYVFMSKLVKDDESGGKQVR